MAQTIVRKSPSTGEGSPDVWGFYEADTGSIQYVAADPASGTAALIDVVWNFDPRHARTDTRSADEILEHVEREKLRVAWVLDTHPHADHLMASAYLKEQLGAPAAIGARVADIAELWREIYHMPDAFDPRAAFDRLFEDEERFEIGDLEARVMLSPGHTLASVTYVAGDAAFVHDTLMYPDSGTSRADFPGGSARELYASIQRILALPDHTRTFVGHDYREGGRAPAWEATVAEQKATNKHLAGGVGEADYVAMREKRDTTLNLPDRILYALQVNLSGGRLPEAEEDGHSYFRIPANRF